MKNFLWTFVVVGLACSSVALEINYGIYQDLRISVSDNVPRQKCQRALDNLEVRLIFYFTNAIYRQFRHENLNPTFAAKS